MKRYDHFIDGGFSAPGSKSYFSGVDPAYGEPWCLFARGDANDVARAVSSADKAFRSVWGGSIEYRQERLARLADALERRFEELVEVEVKGNGKRISEVRGQFRSLHTWYRYALRQVSTARPHALESDFPGVENTLAYEPYGVVAAITPWNSPLMIASWKIAPALAMGNTVVIKPSEHASASTLEFARLASDAGMPSGVINVVTGFGQDVGEALVRHPLVRFVTFTGSDAGGEKVAMAAAAGVKPTTLELGGKSAQLVFPDCNLDAALNGIMAGIFLSNGQSCVAGSRLIVQKRIHDVLVERLVRRATALSVGNPMNATTEIAPLANEPHLKKVMAMIDRAKAEGAKCVCGGMRLRPRDCPNGYFVAPTIFTHVTPSMSLWREEVFGPVLAVAEFETEREAIQLANDTEYGLAAGIWTSDDDLALRLTDRLAVGTVYINHYRSVSPSAPIGGFKRSGYGRELGPDALKEFAQTKTVWRGTSTFADPFPR